jgi:hypothetical protein
MVLPVVKAQITWREAQNSRFFECQDDLIQIQSAWCSISKDFGSFVLFDRIEIYRDALCVEILGCALYEYLDKLMTLNSDITVINGYPSSEFRDSVYIVHVYLAQR